ncbi:MAG TPA: response regulator [Acidisarcina sp.]|nr:response regulator [Acidisarcina sp.]
MTFNVLIVDDSPAMRKFICRVLGMSQFSIGECFEASNGLEALSVLRTNRVDIVLTDINMPVMNGEEFLRQLHADARLQYLPVLVVSTDRSKDRLQQMLSLGAQGYITKPFLPEKLSSEMENLLRRGKYADSSI